jgi:CRISPR-associated exonuclease Cas4
MFGSALLVTVLATLGIVVGILWSRRRGTAPARLVLPRELHSARLLYAEQLFRSTTKPVITARVDRAYRVASGEVVLLELKNRDRNRVFPSDVVELSTQRAAVELQAGEIVAHHAYVAVQCPGNVAQVLHRVRLMAISEVVELAARREAIVSGRMPPRYADSVQVCRRCAFAEDCEKAGR